MKIKEIIARNKLFIIKNKVNELRSFIRYINFKPVGQKFSESDPYGEENWTE